MEEIPESQMNYLGKKIAYYSALVGTLIFVTYLISNSLFLMIAGAVFTIGAAISNVFVLAIILVELIFNKSYWRNSIVTVICMLLNIPLVLLYIFILSHFNL
ncbi:hypothetical protein SAMN04488511_105198 [Pedobacter suwonensis]|uniref:Branched-chain amino acid:cation transporter, LIVCS family n=1 Tax=Pedobacter suwonensis TaxID=332999 RepID=A0A1I0T2E7_9SPHI|nr:hypothetical protein SAMN04488511_105198 [Pedobacter suwonensis]